MLFRSADPGMASSDLFREAIKVFVRVQAGKRLAALGGSAPQMAHIRRARKGVPGPFRCTAFRSQAFQQLARKAARREATNASHSPRLACKKFDHGMVQPEIVDSRNSDSDHGISPNHRGVDAA